MISPWTRAVSFVNARVVLPDGVASSLRFASRVLAIDEPPRRRDVVIDLNGAWVLPGLINAHDHLELNHYGALKGRDRYDNASAWIDDLRPRLQRDPSIRKGRAHPLASRLFIGGLKNLLAGVTTVAHHNPSYREIRRNVPVRVVERYGWAHSFQMERQPVGACGEPGGDVRTRFRATCARVPFILHLGEGIDEAAAAELARLDTLECLRGNTVLVHGVAIAPREWGRVVDRGAGLVWCPASNLFLFGRTAPVRQFLDRSDRDASSLCLGTDSRVTGSRDLLDELRCAASVAPVAPLELLRMVTTSPARMLRLAGAGHLVAGAPADLLVLPAAQPDPAGALLAASRRDVALVTIGGRPMVAAPWLRTMFTARGSSPRPVRVDGTPRLADPRLARAIERCPIAEPGVACAS